MVETGECQAETAEGEAGEEEREAIWGIRGI